MFNVRQAGDHLYGKQLFTWLSLVVSLMASFVLSFFPLDVLDEIWDLIESVSEGFLTYSYMTVGLLWTTKQNNGHNWARKTLIKRMHISFNCIYCRHYSEKLYKRLCYIDVLFKMLLKCFNTNI